MEIRRRTLESVSAYAASCGCYGAYKQSDAALFPSHRTADLQTATLCGRRPLVLQADREARLPCAETADVTRQAGQSGSSSLRAADRPAEPHDG